MAKTSLLPREVPVYPGAPHFNAKSRTDMLKLSYDLRAINGSQAVVVAMHMINYRVMYPPFYMRVMSWLAVKLGQREGVFWTRILTHKKIGSKLTQGILDNAAAWACYGRDTEEDDSYGGFSQREVNFIAGVIYALRGDLAAQSYAVAA